MEDYEAQEVEFWAKLEEEGLSRSSMLRRSAAAAFGLTVLGSASTALGATRAASRPADDGDRGRSRRARQGGEEGRAPQHDRPAARLGELRRDDVDLPEEVRHRHHERQPRRKLGAGEPGDHARSRATRARRTSSTSASPSRSRARTPGLYAKYFNTNYKTIPRAMKDTRGFWMGDYWGAISIGYNKTLISNPPKTWKDLLEARVQGQGRAERQPAHVELGGRGRLRGGARRTAARCRTSAPGSTSSQS